MLFAYQIANKKGKITKGTIEAGDLNAARNKLGLKGGNVISLQPTKKSSKKKRSLNITIGRVKLVDKMMFAKHLSVMIKAGMPLDESLDTLMQQSSPPLAKRLKKILADVRQGNPLSGALRKHSRVFDTMFINMVAAGEIGGKLEENLEIVALQQSKNHALRSKIKAAMLYPTVVFFAILGLIAVISAFVLPKLIGFFTTLNATLPVSTKILIGSSTFFVDNWAPLFLSIIVFLIALKLMSRFPASRFVLHNIILRLPIFGGISKNMNLAIFCRSLGSLLNSGITIDQALKIVAETVTNDLYNKRITILHHQLLQGKSLSEILSRDKHFPLLISRMSKVGERSGTLAETLDYLADFYENEVDTVTKNLSTMLEPALLVTIGLTVGFVAMSIINPIYELTSKVGR
jgi:type IV pilus assembly protein PilC